MPATLPAIRMPCDATPFRQDACGTVIEVAGVRPVWEEPGGESGPPPAASARAEAVFEAIGTFLMALIVLTAIWILIRSRR